MRDRVNGGYAEALPLPQIRQQNPHMHLLEACLSLHKVDPEGGHLARAGEIVSLFEARFTAGPGGLLGERFAVDWSIPQGRDAEIVEPGHQFEWVWLLHAYAAASGMPVPNAASTLYAFACATLDDAGRACQEVTRDCRSFDVLMDEFLTVDGGWIDHYGADGEVIATDMPASTGYHVVLAFAELIRVMKA